MSILNWVYTPSSQIPIATSENSDSDILTMKERTHTIFYDMNPQKRCPVQKKFLRNFAKRKLR